MSKRKVDRKVVRAAIRGSVPDGKLKKARIVLSDAPYGKASVTGFTEYEKKDRKTVVKIGAPDGDNATSITVRGHETRHATKHVPFRRKPMTPNASIAGQIVDDVTVETMPLPYDFGGTGVEEYRRAHIATAMRDIANLARDKRKIERGEMRETFEIRNMRLLSSMRSKAMLAHYRDGADPKTVRQAIKGSRAIRELIGNDTSKALHRIIQFAKHNRSRSRAISMLTALLESAPAEDTEGIELPPMERDPEGELLPVTHGDALEGKMDIVDLRPKSAYTAKERMVSVKYAPDGVHLNPNRYVAAIVAGDAKGLFARRLRHKAGGTVVIDASGSMGATAFNLTQLAQKVPTATIAYYSGNDAGKGNLAIYAEKGKRYSGELPNETLQGGNAVDLAAVRWLLAHPKPWTLVSDLEFTGGVLGSETIAHALVERAVERGELTVYESLDAAYEAFGGKGNLGDAEMRRTMPATIDPKLVEASAKAIRARAAHAKMRSRERHPSAFKSKGKSGKAKARTRKR